MCGVDGVKGGMAEDLGFNGFEWFRGYVGGMAYKGLGNYPFERFRGYVGSFPLSLPILVTVTVRG